VKPVRHLKPLLQVDRVLLMGIHLIFNGTAQLQFALLAAEAVR
jgi:hypothetical protein